MTLALLAAVAMIVQDVLATVLVQAEARNRRGLAALMDALQWAFGIATTAITVTQLQGHRTGEKVLVVTLVTLANLAGTWIGTWIGEHFVTDEEQDELEARVRRLEERSN